MIRAAVAIAVMLTGCASTERLGYLEWRLQYAERQLGALSTPGLDSDDAAWVARATNATRELDSLTQIIRWASRPRFIWQKPPLPQSRNK